MMEVETLRAGEMSDRYTNPEMLFAISIVFSATGLSCSLSADSDERVKTRSRALFETKACAYHKITIKKHIQVGIECWKRMV